MFLVSLWTKIDIEKELSQHHRALLLSNSLNPSNIGIVQICAPHFYKPSLKTNQLLCAWLTFIFIGQSVGNQIYFEEFDCKSLLNACCQNGSQTEKNFGYGKVTAVMLNPHFRWLLIVIFRRMKCNEGE